MDLSLVNIYLSYRILELWHLMEKIPMFENGWFRLGLRSLVLEQAESLRTGGTSLTLFKNGWRVLDAIGVGSELRSQFLEIQGYICDSPSVLFIFWVQRSSINNLLPRFWLHWTFCTSIICGGSLQILSFISWTFNCQLVFRILNLRIFDNVVKSTFTLSNK